MAASAERDFGQETPPEGIVSVSGSTQNHTREQQPSRPEAIPSGGTPEPATLPRDPQGRA